MKIIMTGTTGMVGRGVLLEAIKDPSVQEILLINRTSARVDHPKVKEILHNDFFRLDLIKKQLSGYDACLFCLGVSSVGMKEPEYTHLTYDLTVGFARTVLEVNSGMSFCYVSGSGTDSSERGRLMWGRVKGRTENELLSMPFRGAFMFRPGFIQPFDGVKAKSKWVNGLYTVFSPVYPLLKRIPGYVTDTRTLGKAMIKVARDGYSKRILESEDINHIGRAR